MNGHRVFVVAWLALGILGALNHTIAEKLLGRRFDLVLPHLKYGHVMFNKNLRTVHTYEYAGPDGVRHDLVDLMRTPTLGYAHARFAISVLFKPDALKELCFRSQRQRKEPLTFFVHEYQVDVDPKTPSKTQTLACGPYGLFER